mgnify:CR=1 FL=1
MATLPRSSARMLPTTPTAPPSNTMMATGCRIASKMLPSVSAARVPTATSEKPRPSKDRHHPCWRPRVGDGGQRSHHHGDDDEHRHERPTGLTRILRPGGSRDHHQPHEHDRGAYQINGAQTHPGQESRSSQHRDDHGRANDRLHEEKRRVLVGDERDQESPTIDHQADNDQRLHERLQPFCLFTSCRLNQRGNAIQNARNQRENETQNHGGPYAFVEEAVDPEDPAARLYCSA